MELNGKTYDIRLVSASDFTGYLFALRKDIWAKVDLFGKISIFNARGKKIKKKQANYWVKWLLSHNVMKVDDEPFTEFSKVHNIVPNYDLMDFIEEPLFIPKPCIQQCEEN